MKVRILFLPFVMLSGQLFAQEHHHHTDTVPAQKPQHQKAAHEQGIPGHDSLHADSMLMSHAYSRSLPMSRNGSGTSWVPDTSPMYMYMTGDRRSNWMIHGNVAIRYNKQDFFGKGVRGDTKLDVPNWFMGMHNRLVGSRGLLNVTAMISFDPLTIGGRGYPLLFQSGETYEGRRLVDRQHPHDLISALSVGYTQMINKDLDVTGYLGYPGEPALGPPAFMHRISALNNPDAVLGHHWQDATHIVFGVATIGVRFRQFKLEGSVFTGREPDEDRYNFDKPKFDSYSYRLSFNPSRDWALQVSQGFLNEPELLEPGINVTRTTASVMRSKSLRTMNWSQTLVWAMNARESHEKEHSVLYESNLQLQKQAIYSRYEYVQKSAEELELASSFGHTRFNIHALTVGYNRNIAPFAPVDILLGAQTTLNFPDQQLRSLYGTLPVGFEIYLQLRPRRHRHQ